MNQRHFLPVAPGAIIGYTAKGKPIRVIAGGALNVDSLPGDPEQFQSYLDELNDEQLEKLEPTLVERFKALRASDNIDEEGLSQLTTLSDQIKASRDEKSKRRTAAVKTAAEAAAEAHRKALADLDSLVAGDGASAANPTPSTEDTQVNAQLEPLVSALTAAMQAAVARVQPVTAAAVKGYDLNSHIRNVPLDQVQQHAPDPKLARPRGEAVLIASADIPGRAKNGVISGVRDLVELIGARARMLPVTRGNPNYVPVAYLKRDFRYRLNLDSTPEEVNEVLTAATNVDALVASGGWCSPSEISYDFFNIVCEDGMVDLPSVGVLNRGGFRFPVSPSIQDIFADSDVLWSWTEEQDEAAADDGEDVKTCSRIPCVEFEDIRAHCDGLCVTASNLTTFAYPELVEYYLQLVMAGRAHRTNQLVIAGMATGSTAVDLTGGGEGSAASILNAVDLQAIDYRERFRMCEDAIVEAVFPRWAKGAIRADLANRNGLALFQVTSGMIADWFNSRNVRAQFVADWQSGFTGTPIGSPAVIATDWPASVSFLLYAPGTWVRGQGLQLDLGVVRDSTLNEKNDHTAAWMEDCYAVAQVGHESRVVTTDICIAGVTGGNELTCITAS